MSGRRQIERIAGFCWPADDPRVHTVPSLASPDTLHGFDMIVWDPAADKKPKSFFPRAADVSRRTEEIEQHLAAGGVLVLMIPSRRDEEYGAYGHSIPADVLPFELETTVGAGKQPDMVDPAVFRSASLLPANCRYEAFMASAVGTPLLRIPRTQHIVSSIVSCGGGTVLLFPRIAPNLTYPDEDSSQRAMTEIVDQLIALVSAWSPIEDLPEWSESVRLPGEAELEALIKKDEAAITRAESRVASRQAELSILRRHKLLVTASGPPLESAVAEAMGALGFEAQPGEPGRTDLIVKFGSRTAVVEVKGKGKSGAEKDAAQVVKWVASHYADHGKKAKGILVVNAWKSKPLGARGEVFPAQMLKFATEQKLCLISGEQLLRLWIDATEHPARAAEFAKSILKTVGVFDGPGVAQ